MAQSSPRSSSGKGPARPRAKTGKPRSAAKREPMPPQQPTQPGLLARLFAAIARAGASMVRGWQATDPQVKRVAAALLALAAAIVLALPQWIQISGESGDVIHYA